MDIEEMKAKNTINNMSNPVPPTSLTGSQPVCPQCKLMHPQLKTGEICPNAPVKNEQGEELDLIKFFNQLKNICISQIKAKNIKDLNKLFNSIIMEITKFLEKYKE